MIQLKRVYDKAEPGDGARYLVDRLWPRGLSKTSARLDGWLKDLAPSTELRQWFHRDPQRWTEFRKRYRAELADHKAALEDVRRKARAGTVTLLYAARDPEVNHAVVLRDLLLKKRA
jgi:uncharacterized protein YeaO (DUF488 family)